MSNGDVFYVDLGSGNGSFINDDRVTMPILLNQGDRITVGQTDLEFIIPQHRCVRAEKPRCIRAHQSRFA